MAVSRAWQLKRGKAVARVRMRAGQSASELAREVHAQATLEYALTVLALLAMVVVLALIWRAGEEGIFVHLVEEAASHALSAWGAFDIALYGAVPMVYCFGGCSVALLAHSSVLMQTCAYT